MVVMLDSDTVAVLMNGSCPAATAHLRALSPSQVCISALTRAEIQMGLKQLSARDPMRIVGAKFLKVMRTMPWDAEAADWHAKVSGVNGLVGLIDNMVAAHAIALGAVLASIAPQRYEGLYAPLKIEDWMKT